MLVTKLCACLLSDIISGLNFLLNCFPSLAVYSILMSSYTESTLLFMHTILKQKHDEISTFHYLPHRQLSKHQAKHLKTETVG